VPFLTGSYKWKTGPAMCLASQRAAQAGDAKPGVRAAVRCHLSQPGQGARSLLPEPTCHLFSSADKLSLL